MHGRFVLDKSTANFMFIKCAPSGFKLVGQDARLQFKLTVLTSVYTLSIEM